MECQWIGRRILYNLKDFQNVNEFAQNHEENYLDKRLDLKKQALLSRHSNGIGYQLS